MPNSTASITTKASIDADPTTIANLSVTTGKLGSFNPGADVAALNLTVAGRISSINIRGNLLGNTLDIAGNPLLGSSIDATGSNGSIGSINITGNADGSVSASSSIGTFTVGGDMTGAITAGGLNVSATANTLSSLTLRGALTGTIDVKGNVGGIQAYRDLGVVGDSLRVTGNLNSLRVGTNSAVNGSSLAMDVFVAGNLVSLDVTGKVEGAIFVGGDFGALTVRSDPATAGTALINNNVIVGRDLGSVSVQGGSIGDGDLGTSVAITAGRNLGSVSIAMGDIAADATVNSLLGNIQSVSVTTGSIYGNVAADNGVLGSVRVTGSDLGGRISADIASTINLSGSILTGGAIAIAHNLNSLTVGQDVRAGSSVTLGSVGSINVQRDLLGDLNAGYSSTNTTLTVGRNFALTPTTAINANNSTITVRGAVSKSTLDSRLLIGGNLSQLTVQGAATLDLIVNGTTGIMSLGSLANSVITSGMNVNSLTITGAMTNSLVQAGISPGQDGVFAAAVASKDADEDSRLANINSFRAGSMTNSILAAGGTVSSFNSGAMTDSSASGGLSLGSAAIRAVLDDATPLGSTAELDAARSGPDIVLLRGDITSANVTGSGMTGSYLTAGVGPGGSGDFSDPTVLDSITGGNSRLGSVSGVLGAGSRLVSDATTTGDHTTKPVGGGTVINGVGYTIDNLTSDMGHALEALVGVASSASPFVATVGGNTFKIVVSGPGTVSVYDSASDQIIDSLVLAGTTSATSITITTNPVGSFQIGRVLSADDATVGTFAFDGDLAGDGTARAGRLDRRGRCPRSASATWATTSPARSAAESTRCPCRRKAPADS